METRMAASLRIILAVVCALAVCACAKAQPNSRVVAAGRAFLAQNAHAPGVTVTASGLQYKVLKSGPLSGPSPKGEDEVKVDYEGALLDGTVFDSSYQRGEPAVFGVNGLIAAWTEALQLMRPGDVWELYAPASLAYGDDGAGPIPAGSVLKFKIELLAINPSDAGGGR
jgi:peptidylprolyl isomerase/FKBP-type peptidyl-prolyl cis-trans isomerase FklB